jgi:hypothetical protein
MHKAKRLFLKFEVQSKNNFMSRNIITLAHIGTLEDVKAAFDKGTPPPPQVPDKFSTQIIKLIPADVIGVYLGVQSMVDSQNIANPCTLQYIQWPVFAIVLILTPFYLSRAAGVTDKKQVIIATISFAVWAFSLGGPFVSLFSCLKITLPISIQLIGGIVLMLYTLVVPILYQKTP